MPVSNGSRDRVTRSTLRETPMSFMEPGALFVLRCGRWPRQILVNTEERPHRPGMEHAGTLFVFRCLDSGDEWILSHDAIVRITEGGDAWIVRLGGSLPSLEW